MLETFCQGISKPTGGRFVEVHFGVWFFFLGHIGPFQTRFGVSLEVLLGYFRGMLGWYGVGFGV